jgi:hypothetical protein
MLGVTHLQYADNTLILVCNDPADLMNLKFLLLCFELMSGLKINFTNSETFVIGAEDTTRKKPIRGVHNLVIGGISLYATGKMPLVHAYPWRTACMPRLSHPPMAYMPVRHGYDPYPWRTGLYATATIPTCGIQACTPWVCLYPWCTGLYASGMFLSHGVHARTPWICTPPRICTPQNS